jgi:hypothetical protein
MYDHFSTFSIYVYLNTEKFEQEYYNLCTHFVLANSYFLKAVFTVYNQRIWLIYRFVHITDSWSLLEWIAALSDARDSSALNAECMYWQMFRRPDSYA